MTGETDKARAEFLRSQRKALYSEVVKHEQVLNDASNVYRVKIGDSHGDEKKLKALLLTPDDMKDALAVLANDEFEVEIIGSRDVRKWYRTMVDGQRTYLARMKQLAESYYVSSASQSTRQLAELQHSKRRLFDIEDLFKAAARRDMGGE